LDRDPEHIFDDFFAEIKLGKRLLIRKTRHVVVRPLGFSCRQSVSQFFSSLSLSLSLVEGAPSRLTV
jgi:hypothetical protein